MLRNKSFYLDPAFRFLWVDLLLQQILAVASTAFFSVSQATVHVSNVINSPIQMSFIHMWVKI